MNKDERIRGLEEALKQLYLASGPVSNCAYNAGQYHEDWDNIQKYISALDKARIDAITVYRSGK